MPRLPSRASKSFLQKQEARANIIRQVYENPRTGFGNQAETLKQTRWQDSPRVPVFRRIVELYLTVELLRGLDTHSRLHALTMLFCGHDAVTTARSRCGGDAVTALLWPQRDHARQPRRGHDGCDAVTTRRRRGHDAFCGHDAVTTRSRQDHDAVTTQSQGHDRVTTRSRCGHDAVCGHDTVTVTTRSRCSHDAFCGHDAVTTGPRRGHDAVTVTTRSRRVLWSRQGHDAVTTRSSETQSPQSQLRARILRFHSRRISQKNHANK